MKRNAAALVAFFLSVPALAAPGDMSVETFVGKVDALKAKGAMALFSSDVGALRSEGRAAGVAYTARLNSERAAGRPSSCPPQGVKVNSDRLIAFLRTYPAATRARIPMRTAIGDYFIHTWPCR